MLRDKYELKINADTLTVTEGTTFFEIAKTYIHAFEYPIIAVKMNGHFMSLSDKVPSSGEVEFFDLTNRDANRIYVNGLIYLLIYAVKILYNQKQKLTIRHSIDKGIYIETSKKITEDDLLKIKEQMKLLVEDDLPILKKVVRRIDAINYYKSVGEEIKAEILKYTTNTFITLYKLGDLYDYFYSQMPPSTAVLSYYDLAYINEKGFVLQYPTIYNPKKIREYIHHPGLFEVFDLYHEWASVIGVKTVRDLNKEVCEGKIDDLIRLDEVMQANRFLEVAKKIYQKKKDIKIILLAGPSSSGKTTTSLKLSSYLKSFGINPVKISMDDYFKNRENTPKKADGTYDFESLEAVDTQLFEKNMISLLNGNEIMGPKFNFIKGEADFIIKMKLKENDILLVEGIHALNPVILEKIDRKNKFKIYVSPTTAISIDNYNRISTSDNRMIRRMLRDNRTRGTSPVKTIETWPNVRIGEEENIYPFQDEADVTLNTALLYELGVLRTYVEPLLYDVPVDSIYYEEAKRLLNILKNFMPISSEAVPADSVLREFIGDSCYEGE